MRKMILDGHTPQGHPIFHFEEEKPKMAFDPQTHEIDPSTGFMRDKESGHHVGLHQAPVKRVNDETDWPKWVTPHDSHIVKQAAGRGPTHLSTPRFPNYHVNRADGSVTVLVANEEEEKLALGEYQPPGNPAPAPDEAIKRAVQADIERARLAQEEAHTRQAAMEHDRLVDEEVVRRTAAHQEAVEREQEAAAELAKAQRERLAPHEAVSGA
jgi:hypothetical protein